MDNFGDEGGMLVKDRRKSGVVTGNEISDVLWG